MFILVFTLRFLHLFLEGSMTSSSSFRSGRRSPASLASRMTWRSWSCISTRCGWFKKEFLLLQEMALCIVFPCIFALLKLSSRWSNISSIACKFYRWTIFKALFNSLLVPYILRLASSNWKPGNTFSLGTFNSARDLSDGLSCWNYGEDPKNERG